MVTTVKPEERHQPPTVTTVTMVKLEKRHPLLTVTTSTTVNPEEPLNGIMRSGLNILPKTSPSEGQPLNSAFSTDSFLPKQKPAIKTKPTPSTTPPPRVRPKPRPRKCKSHPLVATITSVSKVVPVCEGCSTESESKARLQSEFVEKKTRVQAPIMQQRRQKKIETRDHALSEGDDVDEDAERAPNLTLCQEMAQRCTPKPYTDCKGVPHRGKDPETGCWFCVEWFCPGDEEDSFVDEEAEGPTAAEHGNSSLDHKRQTKRAGVMRENMRSDDSQGKAVMVTSVLRRHARDKHAEGSFDDMQVQKQAVYKRGKRRSDNRKTKSHASDKRAQPAPVPTFPPRRLRRS
eukprot:TRINITY_DN56525_c0_g1_i1.p1 TRINITY_DN56525_c0_g1~~TRINITY_DN56525_c0_g1_i1.p1  ORF type:complete len:360 (-),score=18.46 TRINITY_DN56525_c0_g1_i1:174-1211(-)